MQQAFVVFERTSKHFSKFIELLKNQSEIPIKDVKKLVCHSSYYALIIQKMYGTNEVLRSFHPEFYLAEPSFVKTSDKNKVLTAVKRCPFITIETRKDFFIVRCRHVEVQEPSHPSNA